MLVSASTARNINVIDTSSGQIVSRIESGDQPHENNFSADGTKIFHASIGTVYTPVRLARARRHQGRPLLPGHRRPHQPGDQARRDGPEDGRGRLPGLQLGRAADGAVARREEGLLPALVLPRLRRVRPRARPGAAGQEPARLHQRRAARDLPARLRAPRPVDEPGGHEAVRGRDHVGLRGDHRPPDLPPPDRLPRQEALLVDQQRRRQATASSPTAATTPCRWSRTAPSARWPGSRSATTRSACGWAWRRARSPASGSRSRARRSGLAGVGIGRTRRTLEKAIESPVLAGAEAAPRAGA